MFSSKILLVKFVRPCRPLLLLTLLSQGLASTPAKLYNVKEGKDTLRASAIVNFDFLQIKKTRERIVKKVGLPRSIKINQMSMAYQPGKGYYCKEGFPLKEKSIYLTGCSNNEKLLSKFWNNFTYPKQFNERALANQFKLPKGFVLSVKEDDLWLFLDSSGLVSWEIQLLKNKDKKQPQELVSAFAAMTLRQGQWKPKAPCRKLCNCYINKNQRDHLIQCISTFKKVPYLHQVMHASPTISSELLLKFLTRNLYGNTDK